MKELKEQLLAIKNMKTFNLKCETIEDHDMGYRMMGGFPGHEHTHPTGPQVCLKCGKTLREIVDEVKGINKKPNIFKRIWEALTKDRVKEIFEHGYKLGREHEKESWESDLRFRFFETKTQVDKKFNDKEMKKATIPVTMNFAKDLSSQLGVMEFDKDRLSEDLGVGYHFEPGFKILEKKGKKITKAELLEISLVFDKKKRKICH